MLRVDNSYPAKYHQVFSSNPNQGEVQIQTSQTDKKKKQAAAYMIGATALASVVAFGILGRRGTFGTKIQKFLGGTPKKPPESPKPPKAENKPKSPATQAPQPKNLGMTQLDKAKNALDNLYEKVITKAKKDGNIKRADIFKQCKDNINSLDSQTVYGNLLEALYKDLRLGEYPTTSLITKNIEKITAKETALIKVKNQNGWHYRIPKNRHSSKSVDRVSVNALADEKLIQSLDDLFASGKVKGYYKTPDCNINWLERHDPITIYLDEKATPDTLDAIKTVCEKYIRSTEDVLSGQKFASGMALQKSPDKHDIEAILLQAKNVDPILEKVLRAQFTDTASGKLITSAGYIDSAKKMIDLIKN